MQKKIILIQGYLAAGKSTFALQLSKALQIPCFLKDNIKEALCSRITIQSRAESSRFSAITFEEFQRFCRNLQGFHIDGETIQIDTTDFSRVDFSHYLKRVQDFMESERNRNETGGMNL